MGYFSTDTASLSRMKTAEMIAVPFKFLLWMKEIVVNHLPAFVANTTRFMVVLTTNFYGIQGRNNFMTIWAYPHFLAFWMSLKMQ